LLIAFAASIALHEIFAGFVRPLTPNTSDTRETVEHVEIARIEHRVKPTPTPRPTPKPKIPHVITPSHVIAFAPVKAIVNTTNGKSAHREHIKRAGAARPKPPHISHAKPIWDYPTGAQGAGAGKVAAAGSLGNGGTGTGAGNSGNGNGATGSEPCGFVDFAATPEDMKRYPDGSTSIVVKMTVHFADHTAESVTLDYPWHYPDEKSNPFSPRNMDNSDMPAYFQPPPPDKLPSEPQLVQYVAQHSSSGGVTTLKDCPWMDVSPSPTTP
jgi:hypothetical protein